MSVHNVCFLNILKSLILFLYNVDILSICMKEFGSEIIIFLQNDSYVNLDSFSLV